jgi:polysaccharide pyruvyl transferase WcaK-like protein
MLRAAIDRIRAEVQHVEFVLLSLYPDDDRAENDDPALRIVPFAPAQIVLGALPLALAAAAGRRMRLPVELAQLPSLREIRDADLVVDLSGISFVDGRGHGILLYNVVLALLPWLLGTPSLKYAQAMGPFQDPINRAAAQFCLPRVSCIAARGRITQQHLQQLGLPDERIRRCADAAFAMPIRPAAEAAASRWFEHPAFEREVVGVAASTVVDDYCRTRGIDYIALLADFVRHLTQERHFAVLLLAHSTRPGKATRKNNDLVVCDQIRERLGETRWCVYVNTPEHADTLRVLIGRCRFLVASRFHAMVSALAMGVPSLLIGWSHKYAEVLESFELEQLAMDYSELNLDRFQQRFAELEARGPEARQQIASHLPEVIDASLQNARLAAQLLR